MCIVYTVSIYKIIMDGEEARIQKEILLTLGASREEGTFSKCAPYDFPSSWILVFIYYRQKPIV
jgi:hypothetical protein